MFPTLDSRFRGNDRRMRQMRRLLQIAILLGLIGGMLFTPQACAETKSSKGSFVLSLIVPGLGEYYVQGMNKTTKFFWSTEAAVWASFAAFRKYGNIREEDYKTFAAVHAKASPGGKSQEFFDDLGFYSSVYEHNSTARADEGPGGFVYSEDDPASVWEWNSRESRKRYRELKNSSEVARRRSLFAIGAGVLTRTISAINASRVAKDLDRSLPSDRDLSFRVETDYVSHIHIRLSKHF